ncbi:MAG: sensor domain-containing diguanylate cyclase [Gammaproteobacteria bacterium]|nr:sensor domain-containing diguanylate cyclase [Gammaproteobacteria bacterium]
MLMAPLSVSMDDQDFTDTPLNAFTALPASRFERYARMARRLFDVHAVQVSSLDINQLWLGDPPVMPLDGARKRRARVSGGRRRPALKVVTPQAAPAASSAPELLIIDDALADRRFSDRPMVCESPHVRFYAGQRLRGPNGEPCGTFFIHDPRPRTLASDELELFTDLAHVVERELAMLSLATVDELTGLSNRRGFIMLAESALSVCRRKGTQGTLLYIDLDGFKGINDRFGHAEGDAALKSFAEILTEVFRDSDVIARLGGDEFCVLLAHTAPSAARHALNRFAATVAELNARSARGYELAYSVGVASLEEIHVGSATTDVAALMERADAKMYVSKQSKG